MSAAERAAAVDAWIERHLAEAPKLSGAQLDQLSRLLAVEPDP